LYNIILSKYPITNKGNIGKTGNDQELSGVFADIKIGSRKIRVYSVHLRSFQISSETAMFNLDYDLASDQGQEAVKNNSIKMVKKFKHAFDKRALQIEELKSHIASSELPVIVAGDFNDTPSSFSYGQLTKTLDDSFKENGSGFGTTYIGPYPPFRIDYILHDPHFTNYAFDTWPVKFSDHYPISALFSMDDVNE
jgi:endonuclease/exonuclease/phosphatase family metal-dependent hydrolase